MVNKYFLIVIPLIFISTIQLFGQSESIRRSNNKVNLSGKNYYIHVVRNGELLSSICKAYQVSFDSVLADNHQISDTILKPNQYLKIRISEEPIKQNGIIYHTVLKGETPYSLSKRYNVAIDEIYRLNPGTNLGLKEGENIKIPLPQLIEKQEKSGIKEPENKEVGSDSEISFIFHKVLKQETIYGIARKYNLTTNEIERINPEIVSKPIQPGDLIKIPVKDPQQAQSEQIKYHKVLKQETLYGIARLYQISDKDLKELNPDIKDRGLIEGELIKVPIDAVQNTGNLEIKNIQGNEIKSVTDKIQTKAILKPDTLKNNNCSKVGFDKSKIYKVAFFLPLYLNVNDTIGKFMDIITRDENGNDLVQSVAKQGAIEDKIYSKSKSFIEFYSGALIAFEKLKESGISFDIRVFDTRGDSLYLTQLLNKNNLDDYNLFIGPVFSGEMSVVSDYAWEHQINIVSPLSVRNNFIEHNPYAFQVSPSYEIQTKYAADFLNSYETKNYIVILDGNGHDQDFVTDFKKQLFDGISSENLDQIKYNEYIYFGANDSTIRNVFTPGIENIVIIPSGDRAFVTDIMGKLNGLSYEFKLSVFGQHRWERFESIDLDHFYNTNTHRFSNSFIDYSNPEVIDFVTNYRVLFKTEPDRVAFQGYDITKYFCSALNKFGHDFRKCIAFHKETLLQTTFNFVPYTDQGGYQNTSIYVLEYASDYTLKIVKTYPNQ